MKTVIDDMGVAFGFGFCDAETDMYMDGGMTSMLKKRGRQQANGRVTSIDLPLLTTL